MLKPVYMAMDLPALHAKVKENLPEWLRKNPHERLLRAGNAKTGTAGRHGLMFKTKGLVLHDCPGKTPECVSSCQMIRFACWRNEADYETAWESVYSYLAHHDLQLMEELLVEDIARLVRHSKVIIRIHEAGDFVSAEHARVYLKIAKRFPEVLLFGYTHSVHDEAIVDVLVEANELPNFQVRESLDESRLVPTGRMPVAYYGARAKAPENFAAGKALKEPNPNNPFPAPKGYFNCPEQYGDHSTKCADCMLCLKHPMDVFFIPQKERIQLEKKRNDGLRDQGVEVKRRYGTSKKDRVIAEQAQAAATAERLAKKEKAS